ncbi:MULTISPECIES: TetR/AcrR family transcriptional regulator [unclassified Fusibacter]|uniref:TetR/AcrR family transcriptional regulator n=1 Tax=unclassified Fusibacter TaxID=2624464 RepID=UPI0013E99265|nr:MULTISPECIES: TetR/AcrR family transcriptional regulator [unclassified Fusibacter]MCK8061577.1 TetR/AcrR family transcriptional regulator [Fusibacter sp. A2]NPE23695.1 TetR/AcrR family transcriptional regulator [Fusibacter sp. A1]
MEDLFKGFDPEKRDRIVNAALKEFSVNTFKKASTNNIVKEAGVSKGLLYHYFHSKKELYDHLETFSLTTMIDTILEHLDWAEKDIFERIKQIAIIKAGVLNKYPYMAAFTKNLFAEKSMEEIKAIIEEHSPDINHEIYTKGIDFSLFKEDVPPDKAIKMIQWTIEKYGEERVAAMNLSDQALDFDQLMKEVDEYLKVLKLAFYK